MALSGLSFQNTTLSLSFSPLRQVITSLPLPPPKKPSVVMLELEN